MNPPPQDQFIRIWAIASLLGIIPAVIAHRKGRSFGWWWLYGFLIFIVALCHALLLKPSVKRDEPMEKAPADIAEPSLPEGTKQCPFCGQLMDALSAKCPVCKGDQIPREG